MAALRKMLDDLEIFVQMPVSAVIEIEGDKANARWIMQEIGRLPDKQTGHFNLAMYFDELVKENGQWLFSKRKYRLRYFDEPPMPGRTFPAPLSADGEYI